jgi:putative membrane protein
MPMIRFLLRWLITAIAVAAAIVLVPGITVEGNAWVAVIFASLIVGLVNATLGLIFKLGMIGCIVMTLGLFTLLINALMLWLSSWMAQNWFNIAFIVDGFWPAFWGGIVISVVSGVLSWFLPSDGWSEGA